MKDITPQNLRKLRDRVLATANLSEIFDQHCDLLTQLVLRKTSKYISTLAIKKFFGIASAKFHPAYYTLNTLAQYCGYQDWADFIKNNNYTETTSGCKSSKI